MRGLQRTARPWQCARVDSPVPSAFACVLYIIYPLDLVDTVVGFVVTACVYFFLCREEEEEAAAAEAAAAEAGETSDDEVCMTLKCMD